MKQNMGNADRIVRLLAAALVAVLFFADIISGTIGYVLLAFATVFVITSLVGYCPLYSLFGINTCGIKKENK